MLRAQNVDQVHILNILATELEEKQRELKMALRREEHMNRELQEAWQIIANLKIRLQTAEKKIESTTHAEIISSSIIPTELEHDPEIFVKKILPMINSSEGKAEGLRFVRRLAVRVKDMAKGHKYEQRIREVTEAAKSEFEPCSICCDDTLKYLESGNFHKSNINKVWTDLP